ncbi:DUF262 domain-containing protein [Nocardioides sp. L-11A]|uniref:DUF262 domain-containing protein n=1 Tax=Nocardioides sp. L-11A TaxID=3043848 RepID=UPI00249AA714|nr:DUF262 domain-containing protein [Nocardioides sp. L-11A]
MDNPEPRSQYLNVVLRQISRTSLRIPRFQRHFVWDQRDVVELLGSIHKGYPIGSVLTWRVEASDEYFSGFRHDPFPPADQNVKTFEVVLDGAQRLSTLFGCLRNAASDPIYSVVFDTREELFKHSGDKVAEPWQIPMDTLFDSRRFLDVQASLSALDDSEILLPRALDLYSIFQDYQIPIIAISNAVLEDVVEVFRRVNSSGTPLSSVDFVRALTWHSSFDLEETFDALVERFQATPLEGFSEDFLVRCLSIAAGLSLDSRDVPQLKELSGRQEGLSEEISAMESALESVSLFLSRLNVNGIREVPYEVQRLLLFSFKLYETKVNDDILEDWFWRSTFSEEHQSKPESYTTRLVKAMREGDAEPALEVRKPVDPDLLALRSRRAGSAVATGFDLLLRRMGARSLLSGDEIAVREGLHGFLFSRQELADARSHGLAVPAGGPLANVVLLSPRDAVEWRTLRKEASLADAFAECASRTDQAAEIWASQGLVPAALMSPAVVLRERSARLLSQVIPLAANDGGDAHLKQQLAGGSSWPDIQKAVQRFVGFDPATEPVEDRLSNLRSAMISLIDELEWDGLGEWLDAERLLGATLGQQVMGSAQPSESLEERVKRVEPYQSWALGLSTNLRALRIHGSDPEALLKLRKHAETALSQLGGGEGVVSP